MDELRSSDPSRIGGHRLLGRLGAGGMGAVYLGRTAEGELAAVKVILPEHAGDADFRLRFRREAEAARRVDSPWAVRVTGSGTEDERPWLATEFVPGPALSEAVARCGPLPTRGVRVLGRLLARALASVHAAGLVHRDVKPGNVLLGADGPRLIDFGVARVTDATALTATDLVVGTPGFLAPEQAVRGAAAVGPAGDVFSLGCLLAHAATGRPPFGSGAVDALLYRTVHEAPDLEGVDDPELRALLTALLDKDPAARPTAAALDGRIVEDAPNGSIDWLPENVVRLIAERSAEALALPGIDATVVDPPDTVAPASAPSRRGLILLAGAGAVAVAGGAAFGVREWLRDDTPQGSGATGPRTWAIGVQADLSGPRAAIGRAQERGVRLAVDRFNAREDKPFTLRVMAADDRSGVAAGKRAAERFARDRDVLAVIGPTDDPVTTAVLDIYDEALLPIVTVSSQQAAFAARSKRSFFQAVPPDLALAYPIRNRLVLRPDVQRLGVLVDRAGGQSAYLAGYYLNRTVADTTDGTTYPRVVPAGIRDLAPVVDDMLTHRSDAFFHAGDPAGAARTARALAATSYKGPRMAMHTAIGDRFLKEAGDAAEGWEFVAPWIGTTAPAVKEFAAAHRAKYGTAPAPWAVEAYDATRMVLEAVTALARKDRPPARSALVAKITSSTYRGISRTYAFGEELRLKNFDGHLHGVRDGAFRYLGAAPMETG
ncbi:bifunctional serine/threonine-protein kinase/ABC transporter substrate-binding protein [Streptomyces sp. NPDC014734]|uniref:bifunctional serine/threonine-protein kinase/ABC transporter substrate-binding protein n=1 Tax=Streptomyces sp. NPDC014734 TaxID=3364886 RepID=UPI0036F81D9E